MSPHLLTVAMIACVACPIASSAQHDTTTDMTHEHHMAQLAKDAALKERGRNAMGFDQDRTIHHFILQPDGGLISVDVSDRVDTVNREAIRTHLRQIAHDFAAGRFDAPLATHAEEPPGTNVMRARSTSIRYSVEDTPGGSESNRIEG